MSPISKRFATVIGVLAILSMTTTVTVSAQTTPKDPPATDMTVGADFYNNTYFAIGLNASLLSGAGLSGRISMPNRLTIQLASFVIAVGDITHFNIGTEAQYSFTTGNEGRLYGMIGAGYYLSHSSDTNKPGNRVAEPFRIGPGVGYEWFTSRRVTFDIGLAFHWFVATGKVLPLPTLGMNYYFR